MMTNAIQRIEEAVTGYIESGGSVKGASVITDVESLRKALEKLIRLGQFAYSRSGSYEDCKRIADLFYGALDVLDIYHDKENHGGPNRMDGIDVDLDAVYPEET